MNDPYGLFASGLPPDLAAKLSGLTTQQQVADALMQQGMSPLQAPDVKGRFQGRISPLAGLAKLITAYMGAKAKGDVNSQYADLAQQAIERRAQALQDYQKTRDGTPAVPSSSVPYNDTVGDQPPQGNITTPGAPAAPGDARAAITQALLNPLLQGNPVVMQDLKRMEPAWTPTKQFNPQTGREEMVLVDKNNPTHVMPMGGQKAPELKSVTTADAKGNPVTTFVNPQDVKTPIAAPVKQEIVNLGGKSVAVNPYQPPAEMDRTVSPDALLHRQTSLEVAGLGPDGTPTGDVKEVAQAIANGQIAPLSSFAMARPRGQAIMSEVFKINPNYDVKDFHAADKAVKDFASGKQGNTVRSFNVGLAHLDTLGQLATALNNGDAPLANKIGNVVATQTGSAAPTNFDAAKQIVGNEIVKAITGAGGGVGDRDKAQESVSKASSPAQLSGVIQTYKALFQGQLNGLRKQYEESTKRKDFDRFLSEQGQSVEHNPTAPKILKFDAQGNPL